MIADLLRLAELGQTMEQQQQQAKLQSIRQVKLENQLVEHQNLHNQKMIYQQLASEKLRALHTTIKHEATSSTGVTIPATQHKPLDLSVKGATFHRDQVKGRINLIGSSTRVANGKINKNRLHQISSKQALNYSNLTGSNSPHSSSTSTSPSCSPLSSSTGSTCSLDASTHLQRVLLLSGMRNQQQQQPVEVSESCRAQIRSNSDSNSVSSKQEKKISNNQVISTTIINTSTIANANIIRNSSTSGLVDGKAKATSGNSSKIHQDDNNSTAKSTGKRQKHKGSKSHLCLQCGRSFSRSDMLTRHSRLHSGLKPYQCGKCKQVFSRSDHLSTHERTHTGEKPYQCQQCCYSACRRDMITRHMRTHSAGSTSHSISSTSTGSAINRQQKQLISPSSSSLMFMNGANRGLVHQELTFQGDSSRSDLSGFEDEEEEEEDEEEDEEE